MGETHPPVAGQLPEYPHSLAGLMEVARDWDLIGEPDPDEVANGEDYNKVARNLNRFVEDARDFIKELGLNPDDPDDKTLKDAAINLLARIAAAGGGGGGALTGTQLASALLVIGSGQTWSARRFYQERVTDASGLDLSDDTYQVHADSITDESFGTHTDPGGAIDVGYPQFGSFVDGGKTIRQVTVRVRSSWPPGASQATVVRWTWNGVSYEYRFTAQGPDEEG